MNRLFTATGMSFPCTFFGVAGTDVLIADIQADFLIAAWVFSDESETSEIKYIYDNNGKEETRVIRGFTSLLLVSNQYGEIPRVRIELQRPFVMEEMT